MIEDVENGRVNCIVTKDLSRFGREHVMMDYYLEFYFVGKQVRFLYIQCTASTFWGLYRLDQSDSGDGEFYFALWNWLADLHYGLCNL
ncbi:MAG: hypothetical protein IJ794_06170 [Lachnospiraceae bacterium]|nr:hypothetical protein [Lachnospiraceae bacterium]